MQPKKRPPKKTAMLEVRVSPQDKAVFLTACLESGQSASTVIRKAMRTHARRIRERPGRLKMTMTMMVMLPFLGLIGADEHRVQRDAAEAPQLAEACEGVPAVWPIGTDGSNLEIPEGGLRIVLTYDLDANGRPLNVQPRAPEGTDAFVTAAVAYLMDPCFPHDGPSPATGMQHAFDFEHP